MPASAEGPIPERRQCRIFGEMTRLADEPVQGVELGWRGPRCYQMKKWDELVLRVLGAPDVG